MSKLLLLPAVVFIVMLLIFRGQLYLMSRIAPGCKSGACGKTRPYACGEDTYTHRINPDYSQFFPFAFFFTIMHVVALVVATVPRTAMRASYGLAAIFIVIALTSLVVLFRK